MHEKIKELGNFVMMHVDHKEGAFEMPYLDGMYIKSEPDPKKFLELYKAATSEVKPDYHVLNGNEYNLEDLGEVVGSGRYKGFFKAICFLKMAEHFGIVKDIVEPIDSHAKFMLEKSNEAVSPESMNMVKEMIYEDAKAMESVMKYTKDGQTKFKADLERIKDIESGKITAVTLPKEAKAYHNAHSI